jgi:ligand-binding SRPBCC domain-containing protein
MTEIKHVDELRYFVDEQRMGPYKIWHHEHHFTETDDGVLMKDKVSYALPFGILGTIAHPIIVKKKLNEIFDYRYQKVEALFNHKSAVELA